MGKRFSENCNSIINAKNFRKRFKQLDLNSDGTIDLNEFIIQILFNEYQVPAEQLNIIKARFKELDTSGDGRLDEEDFVMWYEAELERKKRAAMQEMGVSKTPGPAALELGDDALFETDI